jgi:hypothetical protein
MSLDIKLTANAPTIVFSANITHNLTAMAAAAGIYQHIWHPEELGITKAQQLIKPLKTALKLLKSDPDGFKRYEQRRKAWGQYDDLVRFVQDYLTACKAKPRASISAHS